MGIKSKKEDRIRRGLFWEWSGGGSGTLEKGETGAENASLLSFFFLTREPTRLKTFLSSSPPFFAVSQWKRGEGSVPLLL